MIAKCVKAAKPFDDESVSPVVRQLLLHWGYELTKVHFEEYKILLETGHGTSFVPKHEMKDIGKRTMDSTSNGEVREAKRRAADNDAREQRRKKRARNR